VINNYEENILNLSRKVIDSCGLYSWYDDLQGGDHISANIHVRDKIEYTVH